MLYGWIEVGTSNNALFLNESNEDVIVRTIYGTSKVIVGNTEGVDVPAGMYIHGNNVGVRKVPSSNVQLDVLGVGRIHDMYIGYSNDYGLAVINGPTIWKDITKHSSNVMDLKLQNSNEHTSLTYNGVERIQVTDGRGLTLNDTIYVTEDVFANAFQVTSDRRFKHNITPSIAEDDTEMLSKLSVYDYQMKDRSLKGFIAQEVETVVPTCIQKRKGIVPLDATIQLSQGMYYIPRAYDLLEEGDELIIRDGMQTKCIYKVTSVFSDGHFELDHTIDTGEGKIEGKIVPDVCTIDINQITALNTSVIQSILSRLETLEKYVHQNK